MMVKYIKYNANFVTKNLRLTGQMSGIHATIVGFIGAEENANKKRNSYRGKETNLVRLRLQIKG